MRRSFLAVAVLAAWAPLAGAQDTPVIALPAAAAPPARSFQYTLLPDTADLAPGNAAPLWRQAYLAARDANVVLTDREFKWFDNLAQLPRKEIREYLDRLKTPLRLAHEAARRATCDWDDLPLTIETITGALPLVDVQTARQMAHYLSFQFQYQLAEKQYDDAIRTLQTGFTLARHLGQTPTVIHNLVGVAIEFIMLGLVEKWMQQPNAPNLYWALTALPSPLLDVRKPVEYELGTFLRSFPQLRKPDRTVMTEAEAQKLVVELCDVLVQLGQQQGEGGGVLAKMGAALVVPLYLGEAKKYLTAHGRKAEALDAMPPAQVVLTWFAEQYLEERDEILKWFALPPWQAMPGLEAIEKKMKEQRQKGGLILQGSWALRLLMPAIASVYGANVRVGRQVAALRAVEAVRLHAAAHGGKLPKELKDITEVPLPLNPATGEGFDGYYKLDGGKAVLELPSLRPPAPTGRRYELNPSK